ncbi:uncharacterized protein [Narcine bancroftii]|uniref:uncharacterized protein n=1 Tax=Narcine bancroftii TaxID=1343680 RepID=UPI00383215F8
MQNNYRAFAKITIRAETFSSPRDETQPQERPPDQCNQDVSGDVASSLGRDEIFCPISLASSQFTQEILRILHQAYLDENSVDYFHYNQVTLVNNTRLLHQHSDWLLDMKRRGYAKEELAESFAFLLFETEEEVKEVCQLGLRTGNSDITILGDPMKGVYLCKYSDFLHPVPWHHGKQGYILLLKIIKGRVKPVIENYTSDFTTPTHGYNCHISKSRDKVSSSTSHFQAFVLSQYYLYELEQSDVQHYPRQVYPYAIVAFQYTDYKCITRRFRANEIEGLKIQAMYYYPWKGKLVNKAKEISVALQSNGSPLIPVTLPIKLEIEYAIKIDELKNKLPGAVFKEENYTQKEVCLEGLYCSWYKLVEYLEEDDIPQLGLLLDNLEKKNLAIVKFLQDQGLLLLFNESISSSTRGSIKATQSAAQAIFIFKSPRISHLKDQVSYPGNGSPFSAKIVPLLPAVGYAVEKGLGSAGIRKTPCTKLVEDCLVEYFKMTPKVRLNSQQSDRNAESSLPHDTSATVNEGELPIPRDHQESTISQISHYLTDPTSYILPLSTVLKYRANYLKLCQMPNAKQKISCQSRDLEPISSKGTIPLGKKGLKPGQDQRKRPMTRRSTLVNASPGSRMKIHAVARKQTKSSSRDLCANMGRANPVAGKAFSKSAPRVNIQDSALITKVTIRQAAKEEKLGINKTIPGSIRCAIRSQSSCSRKNTVAESTEGSSSGKSAPLDANRDRKIGTRVPLKTGSEQNGKARKAVDNCSKAQKMGEVKLDQQQGEAGITAEQISRYGVSTWNFVEDNSVNNGPASLHPLSLSASSNKSRSKKDSEMVIGTPQNDIQTNILETDALNILAELAINSAIASLPKSKQKHAMSMHLMSATGVSNKIGSNGSNTQSNCCPNLPEKGSTLLPDTELNVTESHQKGSREPSGSQPLSESSSIPDALLDFPSQEAVQVHNSQTHIQKDVACRSLTAPWGSYVLRDHSYSRPPRKRESVHLAITNPVSFEKEDVIYQLTSLPVEDERRHSSTCDLQNRTHSEVSSKDEERSYEEGTLVGRVRPFRHDNSCWSNVGEPALDSQKENDMMAKCAPLPNCAQADTEQTSFDEIFQQCRYVQEEEDNVKVTFNWKGPYLYQWDSKYTNDPLEKSVNRALHGLWDPTIQETMKDVKLILHMWIGLFYSKSSTMLQTSVRHVQRCIETPFVDVADFHTRDQELALNENCSELAASGKQQVPGVIASSVIKRIEMNSSCGTYRDGNTLVLGETLPQSSSELEERVRERDINDPAMDVTAQISCGGHVQTTTSLVEDESSDNVIATRSGNEIQDHILDQRSTPLLDETLQCHSDQDNSALGTTEGTGSWSSSVTPSTRSTSIMEQTRSTNDDGLPVDDIGQQGIIRQSSVIRELFCTKPQAQQPSRSTEDAPRTCQKPCEETNNLCIRTCKDDRNVEGLLSTERDLLQNKFEQLNSPDVVTENFALSKYALSHSEASNVDNNVDAYRPADIIDTALPHRIGSSHIKTCEDVQPFRDNVETQHERTKVGRLLEEGEISSNSEFVGRSECSPPRDSHGRRIKSIFKRKILEKQSIQQENHHDDFDINSERFDCICDASKEALDSHKELSEGKDGEIHPRVGTFLEDKVAPGINHEASCQPTSRKGTTGGKKAHCYSCMDSECGNFRENKRVADGPLRNYSARGFEIDEAKAELRDSKAHVPMLVEILDSSGRHKVFQNFQVTTQVQLKPTSPCTCERVGRSFCNLEKESFHTSTPLLSSKWDTYCGNEENPIQNILNLEFVHFSCKVNQLVTRSHTAPFTGIFFLEHGGGTTLRRNSIQNLSNEKKARMTVTISHQMTGQSSERERCLYNKTQTSQLINREDYFRNQQREGVAIHNLKNYKKYHKRTRSQCNGVSCDAQEQMVRVPKKQRSSRERGSAFVEEWANVMQEGGKELQSEKERSDSLSNNSPQSLNDVVKEPRKSSYKFYVCETNSDPFFKEIKECLKKEGHMEISRLDLSMIQFHHSGKVLVVIRNEDIATHLHQIPYLVTLKRMHCVQFAGVDSPRDIGNQTFQELLGSGGFIVSDGSLLHKITPEHLQQICELLEKLGSESKWNWMVHFRELKRLKEMAREDSAARRKISLLCQKMEANIVEILPFHSCDSKFQTKPDDLNCLVKLQVQRISSRFAVLLSGKPKNHEIFTQNGITVMDVNNFTKDIRILTNSVQRTLVTENSFL